eukprot:2950359-Amphidinium_carterae.1
MCHRMSHTERLHANSWYARIKMRVVPTLQQGSPANSHRVPHPSTSKLVKNVSAKALEMIHPLALLE